MDSLAADEETNLIDNRPSYYECAVFCSHLHNNRFDDSCLAEKIYLEFLHKLVQIKLLFYTVMRFLIPPGRWGRRFHDPSVVNYESEKDAEKEEFKNMQERGWEVYAQSPRPDSGYAGAVYVNKETKQIVVAHKGVQRFSFKSKLKSIFKMKFKSEKMRLREEACLLITRALHFIDRQPDYHHLTLTGYSLGGHLAEMSTLWIYNDLWRESFKRRIILINTVSFKTYVSLCASSTKESVMNLRNAYGILNKTETQADMLFRALPTLENYFGPQHLEVALTLLRLGIANRELNKPDMSRDMLERALAIFKIHYGPDSQCIEVGNTLMNLGTAYGSLGYHQTAREMLELALPIIEKHYGPEHIDVATTLASLGNAYGDSGNNETKRNMLERALPTLEKEFGPQSLIVGKTLTNLGYAYGVLSKTETQIEILERAITILEAHCGPNHVEVAKAVTKLGIAYGDIGKIDRKRRMLEWAYPILETHYGAFHIALVNILNQLGNVYGVLGQFGLQRDFLERSLTIQEKHYGHERVGIEVANTLNILGIVYGYLLNGEKKREMLKRAEEIIAKLPDTYKVRFKGYN